jgi:4-oxalocrotonate tautomerase
MPVITVQMLAGRSSEQKEQLIGELTRVMETVVGVDGERVQVIITEVPEGNWGRGGAPLASGGETAK